MPSQVKILSIEELEKMDIVTLMSRLKSLIKYEKSFKHLEEKNIEFIEFEDSKEWESAYQDLTNILKKREKHYKVKIIKNRPDFRVFLDLLDYLDKNSNGTGDSIPIYTRTWTEFYMEDREEPHYFIDIFPTDEDDSYFEIKSNNSDFAEMCSVYLYEYCGKSIETEGKKLSIQTISDLQDKFSVELTRARESVFHQSSENNPHPNPTLKE